MKYLVIINILFIEIAFAQTVQNLVITCNACHGVKGISNNDLWPNLAGQKKDYLIKQLKNFRSEERKDPIMNPLSKNLTDEDISKLSEYYSGLK